MLDELTHLLACPGCRQSMDWQVVERRGSHIWEGTSRCPTCRTIYPIHLGIGAFFGPLARPEDLWNEANHEMEEFLRTEPDRARRLWEAPLESLNPTDCLVRSLLLEARREFDAAKAARDLATEGMYTPEYLAAWRAQIRYVKEQLPKRKETVVDLATGVGSLLEHVLPGSAPYFVGTDISVRILRRDQRVFERLGFGDRLSFLAIDARHPPFRDRAVGTMTTNVGLSNIEEPGDLLKELRRVVSDRLLAVSLFFPDERGPNADAIRERKLEPLMYRDSALRLFESSGFRVRVRNSMTARARPTPPGEIMTEVRPDRLPVVDTNVEFCTLVAS